MYENNSKTERLIFDYVNTEKNPADVLTKNVTDKIMNMHGYAIQNGMMDCWNKESVKVSSST